MDRATLNLYLRLAASAALAFTLLAVGMRLERAAASGLGVAGAAAGLFVFTVAALWATSRLNVKRAALWACLVLLGLLPLVLVAFTVDDVMEGTALGGLVVAAGVAAVATAGLSAAALSSRSG